MARILIVDDDPLTRAILGDLLRGLGHDVTVVPTAEQALTALERDPFAAVITDLVMPGMDGLALAQRVAKLPVPPAVVLITGGYPGDAEADARARGVPIGGFLTKPIDGRRLAALLGTPLPPRAPAPPVVADGPEWSGAAFLDRVSGPAERVPPIRLLFLAHRVDASGALLIERLDDVARIVLKSGRVTHIEGIPGLLRGLDPRLPDPKNLPLNLAAAVAAGHAVDRVLDAAALGLGEWLAKTSGHRGGTVRFDGSVTPPPGAFPLPLGIPRILASGLRLGRAAAQVERDWAALGAARPSARMPDDSAESRWGLDASALRVLRLAPTTVDVNHLLREATGADPARRGDMLRALDLLYLVGMIVVDGGPLEREPSASRGITPPNSMTEEDPRVARLRASLAAMESAHPVDVLELGDNKQLTEAEVQQAYRDISRRFHPDTYFSAPPLVRAMAEACFSRINGAYEALRGPGGLPDAQRFLLARAAGRGFVSERDHQAARVACKRAEVLFRNRDWKGADALYAEAVRLDANTWPHAFHSIRAGALSRRLAPDAAVKQLDELPAPDMPRRAEVLVAIANILKLDGKSNDAMRRYKQAVEADPENRDAQRELRLHRSRDDASKATTSSATPGSTPSVLSGFFRRTGDKG